MGRFARDKQAVFILKTPASFTPQRVWDVPPGFATGELYARNLSMREALNFCRTFNRRAIFDREQDTTGWNHEWAITMRYLKDFPRPGKGGGA